MIAQPHIDEFKRWARIGVDQDGIKYIPVAGICLMPYLISKKNNSLLVAKINGEEYDKLWMDKWGLYVHRDFIWKDKWFVPSGFLHFGEDPEICAENLLSEMLKASASSISLSKVISFWTKSRYYSGYHHWHICFVYDVKEIRLSDTPPWFHKLGYVNFNDLTEDNIGVEGTTVLKNLGILDK